MHMDSAPPLSNVEKTHRTLIIIIYPFSGNHIITQLIRLPCSIMLSVNIKSELTYEIWPQLAFDYHKLLLNPKISIKAQSRNPVSFPTHQDGTFQIRPQRRMCIHRKILFHLFNKNPLLPASFLLKVYLPILSSH